MLVASHRPGRNLTEVTVTETSVILRSEYGHLRLMEMENGILRVTFTRRDAFADTPSPYLINRTVRKPVRIDEDSRFLYVYTAGLCARVSMCDGVLETFDRAGNALFRENGLTLFEHQLAAGVGDPNEFEDSGVPIYVYDDSLTRRADCVFIVNGDSMEPDYPNGCMVLVKRISDSGDLAPGDIGAFMIGNETYIKEYQPDGLHSQNPAYPVMCFSEYESVYLIGHVIGILNKEDVAREEDVERYAELHPEFE